MIINFRHAQSAHCENGSTANLLRHHGVEISEAMAFGIGSGIFFIYMPFVKLNGIPLTSFRPLPGMIFKRTTKALGIQIYRKKFRDMKSSMEALDRALAGNIPVGLQVGVFYLTYFPKPYRFHFNAHNLIVYGKEGGRYLISDPVMENVESLTFDELARVRWAKGMFAPKGHMYYPVKVPPKIDLSRAILRGIRRSCRDMLSIPLPFLGVRGIRYLAREVREWPGRHGEQKASLYLGNIVRMQEEIGTGGAGFRFIYASFLEEASVVLANPRLRELSRDMTEAGDRWREFAAMAGRIIKNRHGEQESYGVMSDMLSDIAEREYRIFSELRRVIA